MEVKQILTNEDLEKAFYIRKEVFVKEQNVPLEDEFDQYD
ncbi:GNAT family N-acetyltransferase, partial [Butyricicoccus sp. 1XD8-22]